jgi:predicted nucleic acid-binding protein
MVIDASVWVSLLIAQDVHHRACRAWIGRELMAGTTFAIPAHAPAEVAGAIARRTGLPMDGRQGAATVLATPGLQLVGIDADLARGAANAAADRLLRGADALYAAVAHALNRPLVTLDAELQRRAAGYVQIVVP